MPLYDGTLVMVSSAADGTTTASWTAKGDPASVADSYGAQLEGAGYALQSDTHFEGSILREYSSSELIVSVMASRMDGVTSLKVSALPAT